MFPSVSSVSVKVDATVERFELGDLGRRLVAGVAEMSSYMAWWLAMLGEFDRREGWAAEGARSCSQWLSWKCGIDGRTARAHVRVAADLERLGRVRAAFAEGRLTYSKVRAICRVATPDNEAFLLELAQSLTGTQLDRAVTAYERAHAPALTVEADAERRARCGLRTWSDAEGLFHAEIVLPPEDGALVDAALAYGRDHLHRHTGTRPAGPTGRADALVWVLRRGLVNAERPDLDDDSPYTIIVHVQEAQALIGDDGHVELNGMRLHPRTLQRLGCDSLVQGMLEGLDRRPLDLGRSVRTATRKQRRALTSMYATCQFPGCDTDVRYCEFHHLDWWSQGGRSDLHVFRPLCGRHHHQCHEGGWRLIVRVDGNLDALPPTPGASAITNAPALTDHPVAPAALIATNRGGGRHAPLDDAIESLAGRWGGEPLTTFALSVIVEHTILETAGPDADPTLVLLGHPPSPN